MTKKPDFVDEVKQVFKQSWDEAGRRHLDEELKNGMFKGGTLVTRAEHPDFYYSVAKLVVKGKLDHVLPRMPHIVVVPELPGGPVWIRKLPNAGASPSRIVLVSQSMMDMTESSLSRPMSPMLETIMAHEFSHLKDGTAHALVGHFGPYALPLIAMVGLHLYDRAREKNEHKLDQSKKDYCTQLTNNIHTRADEEIARCKAEADKSKDWHVDPQWHESIMNAGRYALVAAIGLGVGLLGARYHSRSAEFRADKFAVEVTGHPEEYKRFFAKAEAIWEEARKNKPKADTLFKQIEAGWHKLIKETIMAHPSTEERLSYIDRVVAEKRATTQAAAVASHLL